MKQWKRILLAVALGLWGLTPTAQAGTQGVEMGKSGPKTDPLHTVITTGDTNSAGDFGPQSVILGVKTIATGSNAMCVVCDSATYAGCSNTNIFDEIPEATSGQAGGQPWSKPWILTTDLSVHSLNANCVIYY